MHDLPRPALPILGHAPKTFPSLTASVYALVTNIYHHVLTYSQSNLPYRISDGLLAAPILGAPASPNMGTTPDAKRWSRRLYVGNLPAGKACPSACFDHGNIPTVLTLVVAGDECTKANLMKFFIAAMKQMGLASGDCVTEVFIAEVRRFAHHSPTSLPPNPSSSLSFFYPCLSSTTLSPSSLTKYLCIFPNPSILKTPLSDAASSSSAPRTGNPKV